MVDGNASRSGDDAGSSPSQAGHALAIETPLGADILLLTSLEGVEAVSRGFVYTIEFLTRASESDVRSLLGRPTTLWLCNDDPERRRPLHGHVRNLTQVTVDPRGYWLWRAEVAPWLWFLTQSVDCKIFQNLTIPEILRSVFNEHHLLDYEFRLHREFPKCEFCVQYRESAFAFVSRLMEHVGIFYLFEHHSNRHVLVLGDYSGFAKFTTPQEVSFSVHAYHGEIQSVTRDYVFRPGNWALNDFDFEFPTKNLHTCEQTVIDNDTMKRFEIFDYPGQFYERDNGTNLTRLRVEQEETQHQQISGTASCVGFDPGKRFVFASRSADHDTTQGTYFLTEVCHAARETGYFSRSEDAVPYTNRFSAIPAATPFRPARLISKPVVHGPQTATVVGPAGENIYTDQYGRIRVLFHWDRHGKRDENASCWIRVSQQAAGSHSGGIAIPHVGQEVVVSFLEGDPDRPIVIGRVHNGANTPPLNLPRDKDKTILRDHGDNKLIMHGKTGKQWMSMVSPRAINFVAMRSPAKPLSASVDTVNGTGPNFDDALDSGAFQELQRVFLELTSPPPLIPPPQSTWDPKALSASNVTDSQLDSLGDFSASTIDINSLSEGSINSLALQNVNTWVGANLNQEVIKDTETLSHGSVRNIFKSSVHDTFDTTHEEETTLHNEVTGFHTEEVGLHAEVTGIHVEDTGIHIELHDGIHFQHDLGFHIQKGDAAEVDLRFNHVETADDKISAIQTELKTNFTSTEITEMIHTIKAGTWTVAAQQQINMVTPNFALVSPSLLLNGAMITLDGALIKIG